MKRFDDIFRENVEKAFGSFDASDLADEGWNSFLARKKGRGRFLALIPLWVKAASVAIMIGTAGFLAYYLFNGKPGQDVPSLSFTPLRVESGDESPLISGEDLTPVIANFSEPLPEEDSVIPEMNVIPAKNADEKYTLLKGIRTEGVNIRSTVLAESLTLSRADSMELSVLPSLIESTSEEGPVTEKIRPDKHSGTLLMAGFSGLLAMADEGISTAPGVSMGFYLEQKITPRISVRPGLALSRQSLGLGNSKGMSVQDYAVSLNDGTSGTVDSYDGQLDMIALEVPVNIVFRILQRERSEFYVSAGTSTLIYLSQNFSGDFVNEYTKETYNSMTASFSSETHYTTVEVRNNYAAFSRVDLFRLVNLSAGYSFPYSRSGTLIIEPFVQLPLDDLTSLDMRIRYGGISVKVRFGNQDQAK